MGNVSFSDFKQVSVGGDNKIYLAQLNMSNSYAVSGDTIDLSGTPFNTEINNMIVIDDILSNYRYDLKLNPSALKIKAYENVVDILSTAHHHSLQSFTENRPVVADVATSSQFPVLVQSVYSLAGVTTGSLKIVPSDQAPASGECSVTLGGPKLFTFNAGDAVTSAELVYLYVATTDDDIGSSAFTDYSEVAGATDLSSINYQVLLIGR